MMNKSTMKKIASAALASVMAMSLSVPAFAVTPVKPVAETSESKFEVELEGMIYTPTIRVQVTQAGSVYVNPTKSVVAGTMTKALDGTINLDYAFDEQGVISTPILIRSDTDKALNVQATAKATVPKTSGIKLVGSTTGLTSSTEKQVHLQVIGNDTALGDSDALKTTTTTESDGSTSTSGGLTEANLTSTAVKLSEVATDGKSATTAAAAATTNIATIGAANPTMENGKMTAVEPQYGVVAVSGSVASKATWEESDIVNVTVALTFSIDNT